MVAFVANTPICMPPHNCSEIVNFIESGLKGDLPDAYCTTERAFPVAILATCQEPNRIRNCRCCLENSTTLLQVNFIRCRCEKEEQSCDTTDHLIHHFCCKLIMDI